MTQIAGGDLKNLRTRVVAGGAAGNITVTDIDVGDNLVAVQNVAAAGANLASEFTITAADTINNTGGTSTAGMTLLVIWEAVGGGRQGGRYGLDNLGRFPI